MLFARAVVRSVFSNAREVLTTKPDTQWIVIINESMVVEQVMWEVQKIGFRIRVSFD